MFRTENSTMLQCAAVSLAVLAIVLSGCGPVVVPTPTATPPPPAIGLVVNPDITDVLTGQTVALAVDAIGEDLRFKWSVSRGKLSAFDTPAVFYTAPDSAGVDTVTVEVSNSSGTTLENLSFNVVAPDMPTPMSFQNFEPDNGTPGDYCRDAWFTTCSFESEIVREGSRAVRVHAHAEADGNPGDHGGTIDINPSSSDPSDLASATTLSVWVYDTQGNNTVRLRLRDSNDALSKETWSEMHAEQNNWTEITWSLSDFTGVDLSQIKNIELYEWSDGVYYFDAVSWQTCPYQVDTDKETIVRLIQAESEAVNNEDIFIIRAIFAEDAIIRDAVSGDAWNDPKTRYENLFANVDYTDALHFEIQPAGSGIDENAAWFTSGSRGSYAGVGFSGSYDNPPGSNHWTFGKNSSGCWVITEFTFNAGHIPFPPPTATPTSTPACPSGVSCYSDDFSELDTKVWCKVPQEGFTVGGGQFVITANKDILYEIHPCEHLSWNLRFVELTLRIDQPTGPPGNAHTGIGASLSGDRYLNFYLDSAGDASLEHGYSASDTPPQIDETIGLGRVGESHTLRIEWTGNEVLFFVDGSQFDTRIASDGYGSWFFLSARAYAGASTIARFDGVRWGVSP